VSSLPACPAADPPDLRCQVCVIGSGPGGATAARVLAERGQDVVVLEEGADLVGPAALVQRDLPMYDQLYSARGARTTADRSITVLGGRVLGGGSVVNVCDVVPIDPQTLRYWQTVHGVTAWSDAATAPFRDQALRDLEASPIPESLINANNALLRDGARALGWAFEVMRHNRVGCQGLGTCMIGCPIGAKRNARMVQIPRIRDRGGRIVTRARAVSIDDLGGPVKTVRVEALDALGRCVVGRFCVRADRVVVAANPVGTVPLLYRSGLRHSWLGRAVSLQPQLPIIATFDRRIGAFDGIPQAVAVTQFERHSATEGLTGFRIEAIFGTPGILGSMVPVPGAIGKQFMAALDRVAASLLLVPDRPVGRIDTDGDGRPRVEYEADAAWKAAARQAVRRAGELYFAVGARQVAVPTAPMQIFDRPADLARIDDWPFHSATATLISAHQQGGARAAPDRDRGVCRPSGELWDAPGVFVVDSSIFPSTASSHTMTPIWTMAGFLAAGMP